MIVITPRVEMDFGAGWVDVSEDVVTAVKAEWGIHGGTPKDRVADVGSMSFSVGELAASIREHIPGFRTTYRPDYRQAIADSWPSSVDDTAAREEWDWRPEYDLQAMTEDMLTRLRARHEVGLLYR